MMGRLNGKTVMITGASGGIGKETAIRFSREGDNLAICARTTSRLEETKELCEKEGVKVVAITCDVSDEQQLIHFVDETIKTLGTIDVLINNAIDASPGSPFIEQSEDYLTHIFNTGYLSTWRLMKLCYPYLKQQGGSVINFASAAGITGGAGYAAYGSIKEAIVGLSKTVAREWGNDHIRVNCIAPTAITPKIQSIIDSFPEGERRPEKLGYVIPPLGRIGNAYDDITPVLLFLASDDSSYMTGQTLRIDGGATIF